MWVSWIFFFQAEDGIRDSSVTGVQTCALPILQAETIEAAIERAHHEVVSKGCAAFSVDLDHGERLVLAVETRRSSDRLAYDELGRAIRRTIAVHQSVGVHSDG